MVFEPIAIVGRSCVLPGALTPESFYAHLRRGHDFVQRAPQDRWRLAPHLALNDRAQDGAWSDMGGYVRGFEALFDADDYHTHSDLLMVLDPLFRWGIQSCTNAWRDAGLEDREMSRGGVILGHLSFPSEGMTSWAEREWLKRCDPSAYQRMELSSVHPYNRFMSGYPAHLVAEELGLQGESYCLDAACASSLYAIKMAAWALQSRRADVMIAGAIQRADSLFLHVGFCALQAMSKSGQSRPFHQNADGLIPAEGAAALVLMRLDDAITQGRQIHGVIRGVGLSNDGRSRGFLAPSSAGQQVAMRAAYQESGLSPSDIQYVECHATGTTLGDRTELESMAHVWGEDHVHVGSHKSNIGHAITAAGLVGTLKVLESMKQGVIPQTIHLDDPDTIASFPETMHVVHESMPWYPAGKRRAAVSAFGFGGNNAHMIVEQWSAGDDVMLISAPEPPQRSIELAVVALEVLAGDCDHADAFADVLFDGQAFRPKMEEVQLDLKGIKFPPNDMAEANTQQWLMLKAARRAAAQIDTVDWSQTAILIGMQCDTMALRYGARWRLAQWAEALDYPTSWVEENRDRFITPLRAQSVVGTMPNVPANRINAQLDARGPSFTVSGEELSGLNALSVAYEMLSRSEVQSAVVGAVEMGAAHLHEQAVQDALHRQVPGVDAACVFILKTKAQALEDGDDILAVLTPEMSPSSSNETPAPYERFGAGQHIDLTTRLGHAHSAQAMLDLGAGVLSVLYGRLPFAQGKAQVWSETQRVVQVHGESFSGQTASWWVTNDSERVKTRAPSSEPFRVIALSGASREEIRQKILHQDSNSGARFDVNPDDPIRLACVVTPAMEQTLKKRLLRRLDAPEQGVRGLVALFESPLEGKVAFVYPGSGSVSADVARQALNEALVVFPEVLNTYEDVVSSSALERMMTPSKRSRPWSTTEEEMLHILSLSALHTTWSRALFNIEPDMASGVSLGESSALFSLGVWGQLDDMIDRLVRSEIFKRDVVETYDALRTTWFWTDQRHKALAAAPVWCSQIVFGPVDEVAAAVDSVDGAFLTMIHTPDECIIAGFPDDLKRVQEHLNDATTTFIIRPLEPLASVHAHVISPIENAYKTLHTRPIVQQTLFPIYGHGALAPVEQTSTALAESIYAQAFKTVDYPAMVNQLWGDGARIFIEHGPGNTCTQWIGKILGDRDHIALSYDRPGASTLVSVNELLSTLWAAGLDIDLSSLDTPAKTFEPSPVAMPLARKAHEDIVTFASPVKSTSSKPSENEPVSHETNDQHPIELEGNAGHEDVIGETRARDDQALPGQPVEKSNTSGPGALFQTDAFKAAMKARRKRADDLVRQLSEQSDE